MHHAFQMICLKTHDKIGAIERRGNSIPQFYVDTNTNELSCKMYQRSADMFLGVPFNIASYALLTHIIAKCTNLSASNLHISFGDTHVYSTHIDAVKEQLSRSPKNFPTINIKHNNIDDLKYEDFQLINYNSHPVISAKMSI